LALGVPEKPPDVPGREASVPVECGPSCMVSNERGTAKDGSSFRLRHGENSREKYAGRGDAPRDVLIASEPVVPGRGDARAL